MRAEPITDPIAFHGEGPVWSTRWTGGELRWVDMLAGDILSLSPGQRVSRRHVARVAAVVRPRLSGGAVIGVERGFAIEDPDGSIHSLPELWADASVRMNEGGCDPDGRFYCGSTAYDECEGAGSLYRLDSDRTVRVVLDSVTISNGLEWSPDGDFAYYVDTPTGRVDVFEYDSAAGLSARRPFATIPASRGKPDGLTVDEEGGVWVALFAGGRVNRYTPTGKLDGAIEVAARNVTACAFGGPELDRLYITTSRKGVDSGDDPLAGSLFEVVPGIRGLSAREYRG